MVLLRALWGVVMMVTPRPWNAKSLAICTNAVIWLIMLYGRNTTCGAIAVQSSREQKKGFHGADLLQSSARCPSPVDYQPTAFAFDFVAALSSSRRSYLEVLTVDGAFRRFTALSMSKDGGGSDAKILFRATLLKLNTVSLILWLKSGSLDNWIVGVQIAKLRVDQTHSSETCVNEFFLNQQ
ncbi:hypothetical protein HAX54_034656 [Datura stramonium]|uniref:Secreted protein n=1 Tax=Datura stramonium TaxID=4076 RepID=A0ABS8VFH8_DATST|nr:hypothetical protein [Datura stramonium]